jgi:transketolase N-terminal domain/subunit
MWQTITALFGSRGKYISFGATVIYCDANNVCSVHDALDEATYANADAETEVSLE